MRLRLPLAAFVMAACLKTLLAPASWATAHEQISQISHDPSLGTVEGVVVNANNKPIKGASVYADNLSMPSPARPYTVETDAQGHFVVDNVYPGDILMRAYKEADKYGDVVGAFGEPIGTNPKLEMKAGENFKGVVIRLDRKAGLLRFRVVDASTNELIRPGITIQMCRGGHLGEKRYCLFGSVQPDYRLFVPALVPLSISISAPNHSDWAYEDKARKSPNITLAPGEDRTLKIKLQPAGTK